MQPRPEQNFFADTAMDRALGLIMTLAAELHVVRDHANVLETLLVEKGVLQIDEVKRFEPTAAQAKVFDAERDEFVAVLMRHVRGDQVSANKV
jgi:hypothetical protein